MLAPGSAASSLSGATMVQEIVAEVTVDRCPNGHGVWLDHNELEQITGNEDPLEEYDEEYEDDDY